MARLISAPSSISARVNGLLGVPPRVYRLLLTLLASPVVVAWTRYRLYRAGRAFDRFLRGVDACSTCTPASGFCAAHEGAFLALTASPFLNTPGPAPSGSGSGSGSSPSSSSSSSDDA